MQLPMIQAAAEQLKVTKGPQRAKDAARGGPAEVQVGYPTSGADPVLKGCRAFAISKPKHCHDLPLNAMASVPAEVGMQGQGCGGGIPGREGGLAA